VSEEKPRKKVVFCVPTMTRPFQQTLDSLRDCIPAITAAGWEEGCVNERGCPYISAARATMLRKALYAKATHIVFIDHDVSWRPEDMVKLLETHGDVVCGTYRFKTDEEETYMGSIMTHGDGRPRVRACDGAIEADGMPAGFLKVSRHAINRLIKAHPELCYGEACAPHFDLFNHGAFDGVWWGEDMGFCRRWNALGEKIWLVPDMNIDHHTADKVYPGNYHQYLLRRPGGSEGPPLPAEKPEHSDAIALPPAAVKRIKDHLAVLQAAAK
jgi:hypothetical protein